MEYQTISISIASRIEWCRRQKTQARTQLEREGWQAEVEGLCALLAAECTGRGFVLAKVARHA